MGEIEGRRRRKRRIRRKVSGRPERPRLTVFRSARHTYAQVIDDTTGRTLASACTVGHQGPGEGSKTDRARAVGAAVARACLERGITRVVFDRNGYLYHGRVRAVADAAREAGLQF
ncbi:MAG: 50S ribosomal protein L18 [Myxococcota bacterium]|nr:50S ribosomal protein L18 [Myxococcota bacterium]MDW8363233.1 50S ribosomal protein L18 [Myxococcales bacterium]